MIAIERAIKEAGGQQVIADACGVSQSLVSQWVNGVTAVHARHFEAIQGASRGRVTAADLLADEMTRARRQKRA